MADNETAARPVACTDENFPDILKAASTPILLEFWAPWCHHCRMLAPVIDEVSAELAGQVLVGQVNCDLNEQLPEKFNVEVIPTLFLVRGGELLGSMVNPKDRDTLMSWVSETLG